MDEKIVRKMRTRGMTKRGPSVYVMREMQIPLITWDDVKRAIEEYGKENVEISVDPDDIYYDPERDAWIYERKEWILLGIRPRRMDFGHDKALLLRKDRGDENDE